MLNSIRLHLVADAIEATPTRFNMNYFIEDEPAGEPTPRFSPIVADDPCNTVMCIGGWATVIATGEFFELTEREMANLLGLTPQQGSSLFYASSDFWCELIGEHFHGFEEDDIDGAYDTMTANPLWVASVLRNIADGTIEINAW